MKPINVSIVIVGGVVALAASHQPQQSIPVSASGGFVITNVRGFDGEQTRFNMHVVVQDGLVRAVNPGVVTTGRLPIVDGSGSTLVPGLIDAHVHSRTVDDLQQALRFGVTSVLDMAMMDAVQQRALREAAATRVDVADFRSAGIPATSPGGHGTQFGTAIPTIATADVADAFVAARHRDSSDYLKVILNGVRSEFARMPNLDGARVSALVRAGHSRGMLVVAHAETVGDVRIAIDSGVDGLVHVWRDNVPPADIAAQIARRGMFVVPTLAVSDGFVGGSGAALAADARLAPYLTDSVRGRLLRPPAPTLPTDMDGRLAAVRALRIAGARLLAGTDSGSVTPTVHGLSVHRELELLVKAGLRPAEALTAATATAADAFHLTDRGRIVAGRRADLVLVRGDPTTDITASRDIVSVWRSGVHVRSSPCSLIIDC